jgi:hypothetical protein
MRRLALLAGSALVFAGFALAESWSGTLVDVSCAKKDLATHTRKCAVSCARGGYGLVTADGKFHKFNEAGNIKALEALKSGTKDADLKATVTGKMSGELIEVESVSLN